MAGTNLEAWNAGALFAGLSLVLVLLYLIYAKLAVIVEMLEGEVVR